MSTPVALYDVARALTALQADTIILPDADWQRLTRMMPEWAVDHASKTIRMDPEWRTRVTVLGAPAPYVTVDLTRGEVQAQHQEVMEALTALRAAEWYQTYRANQAAAEERQEQERT